MKGDHLEQGSPKTSKSTTMKNAIALFGLSANPPTGEEGHIGIVRYLVHCGRFKEVWVLPVYQHMFTAKRKMEAFEHRMEMCKLCFVPESTMFTTVRVMPIEKEAFEEAAKKEGGDGSKVRIGTVDVIRYIREKCVDESTSIHLVLGADTFKDLVAGKWKQSAK